MEVKLALKGRPSCHQRPWIGRADHELSYSRYGVTKLERYESREQLVDLLETVVTWLAHSRSRPRLLVAIHLRI